MTTPLLLILVAAMAFLATHVAYEWLAKRLLIVSGAEYLVLGVLLGPYATGLFSPAAIDAFQPIVILGIGWMGIAAGMPIRLQRLVRIPSVAYRLSLVEALATFALVAAGAASALSYGFQVSWQEALAPAMCLGAIAVASTPAGLDVAFSGQRRSAPVLQQMEVAHGMDGMVSVLAFGLLLAFMHADTPIMTRPITTTEWAVITIGIGVVGGTLFHLFLGDEQSPDRLVIALGGAVILTSGAAAHLELSPALAAFAMGVVLANSLRDPRPVEEVLRTGERPLYYVLLLLAGASWRPESNIVWWLVIIHYLVLRTLAKLWGTGIVTWINGAQASVGLDWGRALIGQGRLTIALALDYSRRDLPFGEVIFTCAAVSVLFTEFFAARFVRSAAAPLLMPLEQVAATTEAVVESVTETMAQAIPGLRREDPPPPPMTDSYGKSEEEPPLSDHSESRSRFRKRR
jgi:Kef-type K+ transport system membrane component KefB